jgi:hypothetical protein
VPDFGHPRPSRIERGNYIAQVLHHTSPESFWYYIIQRNGSNGVIDLVKFDSYQQAVTEARQALQKLNQAATHLNVANLR